MDTTFRFSTHRRLGRATFAAVYLRESSAFSVRFRGFPGFRDARGEPEEPRISGVVAATTRRIAKSMRFCGHEFRRLATLLACGVERPGLFAKPGHERRLEVVTAPADNANTGSGWPTVARVRRAIFARHCNPWSAWTRWASTPLTLVPAWTRRWSHAALIALWFAVNPFVFGKPAHQRAWSTRAMLGEELWISRRPRDAATLVSAVASAAALSAVVAARRHRPAPAAIATAIQMALTLVYWEQMVRYFNRQPQ